MEILLINFDTRITGGGNGNLSEKLSAANWQSTSYDPFPNGSVNLSEIGTFDLITAFEVFEHVPQVNVKEASRRITPTRPLAR